MMKATFTNRLFIFLMIMQSSAVCFAQSANLRKLIENGRTAYQQEDFGTSLTLFEKANELRPNHPMIVRLLVRLNSLTNRKSEAYEALQNLMLIDADVEFLLHQDLQAIHGDERFKDIQQKFEKMNKVEGEFDTIAVVTNRRLHPESIVVLPDDRGILLGSVHEKRIVHIKDNGEVEDWVPSGTHGLYAVMGMKVDPSRNLLWVASTATPQMVWYSDDLAGKAAVFAFDLNSKELVKKFEPQESDNYWFGDLTLDAKGAVYVSNSQTPEIFRISSIEGELEMWQSFPELISLQGLVATNNQLFFADYLNGVYSIDLNDDLSIATKILSPTNTTLKGIDGLYMRDSQLITIQNGVYPNRVCSWNLSEDKKSLTSMNILDKANPLFGEPTLGMVSGDVFYYIANSQWTGYQSDGTILKDEQLDDVYILKVAIK